MFLPFSLHFLSQLAILEHLLPFVPLLQMVFFIYCHLFHLLPGQLVDHLKGLKLELCFLTNGL